MWHIMRGQAGVYYGKLRLSDVNSRLEHGVLRNPVVFNNGVGGGALKFLPQTVFSWTYYPPTGDKSGDTNDDPRNLLTRVICSVISPRLSHQGGNSPREAILSSLPTALVSAPTGIFIKLRMLIF